MAEWIDVCDIEDIDCEDVLRFDHLATSYAIYRDPAGQFFATDGKCTHENVQLSDGLVIGDQVECPKHNGRFNYKTGAALRAPVCIALKTFPVRTKGNRVEIALEQPTP